jgi:hypothetical protein
MAQSVNLRSVRPRPELGVKPTCRLNARTSQFTEAGTSPSLSHRHLVHNLPRLARVSERFNSEPMGPV